uniref:Fc receptor, IgE, low affinity II, alpha polypeptide n=1 Tax=Nannospalax galili TaxID=1026970 RepID=A0A8C6QJJ8_NANGA
MELNEYSGYWEPPRKRCCCARTGTQLILLGLVTAAMWAGLLTLLLLWHWDTEKNLKHLEDAAVRNVSHISKDLQRYQREQMNQQSQAAQMSKNMQELGAEQKQMKSQDSQLSKNMNRLQEDLNNIRSRNLNEKRTASDSLERLQEEVSKLWISVQMSKGSACNTCPKNWLNFQQKCYYFGKGSKQWIQAKFTCSNLKGQLVSIHSQEEQDFLTKHIKEDSWIGLRDLFTEGEFVWMDDSPVGYSNWNPGEPNNGGQGEDCVMMWGSGQWNDAFCRSYLESWVCEQLATCEPSAPLASMSPLSSAEPAS